MDTDKHRWGWEIKVVLFAGLLSSLQAQTVSIVLLNQTSQRDGSPLPGGPDFVDMGLGSGPPLGVNLHIGGGGSVFSSNWIVINSSANGDARTGGRYAVMINSASGFVQSPSLQIATDGPHVGAADPASLSQILDLGGMPQAPVSGAQVSDPTLSINFGKQPRIRTVTETVAVNGVVYGALEPFGGAVLTPGTYVGFDGKTGQLTLDGIHITGDVFLLPGTYHFLGGLKIHSGTVAAGDCILAMVGTIPEPNGGAGTVLEIGSQGKLLGSTGGTGQLFLFTTPDYGPDSGNPVLLDTNASYLVQPLNRLGAPFGNPVLRPFVSLAALRFGQVNLQAGAELDVTGLQNRPPCVPGSCGSADAELYLYQTIAFWRDRRDNLFQDRSRDSAVIRFQGARQLVRGAIYEARGSLLQLQGGNTRIGLIITGALEVQSNAALFAP